MRPDIVIYRDGAPILVLDAKYKLQEGRGDLYQAVACCHAMDLPRAVLVHPAWKEAPSGNVQVRGSGDIEIRYAALSLAGGPEGLTQDAHALAMSLATLLTMTPGIAA